MKVKTTVFVVAGLLLSLVLAGIVSNFASGSPDGLDSAALKGCTTDAEHEITGGDCMAKAATDHQLSDSPFADYATAGIGDDFLSTAISGVLGVLVVFAVGAGLFWLVKRRTATSDGP